MLRKNLFERRARAGRTSVTGCLLALVILAAGAISARADWMNLTGAETSPNIAEITILDDRVRIALEIYIGDLETFQDLLPDDWLKAAPADRLALADRLKRFSSRTLPVVTDTGTSLSVELKLVEARVRKERYSPFAGMINPTTRQRVSEPPSDKRVVYAELDYPFGVKPESLTFAPPQDEDGTVKATIGFIAYHKAVPIIDFRYLSAASKVELDWDDPWYTKFDNPNLKRHHKSALMSFLYVEPREVRHEVLIRARELQDWTDLGLDKDAVIGIEEQSTVKERAGAFFVTRNPLSIDGKAAAPVSSRVEFLDISLTGLQVIEEPKQLDLSTAIVGVILSYPVKHLPKQAAVRWDLFNERTERIPATAIDPAGPLASYLEADDPTFEWRNHLLKYQEPKVTPVTLKPGGSVSVPILSVVFLVLALAAAVLAVRAWRGSRTVWAVIAGLNMAAAALLIRVVAIDVQVPLAGPPDETASAQIVTAVLTNVNHAFLENQPDELRRALGVVVAEDKLEDVEPELQRALAVKITGGGIARVDAISDVTVKDVAELDGAAGFSSLAEWSAKATAGHWGHVHRRDIRFRALVEMVRTEGAWKLAGLTVVDVKQEQ